MRIVLRDEIMRKFLNSMVTYKRIKRKLYLDVSSNNSVKFLEIIFYIIDSSIVKTQQNDCKQVFLMVKHCNVFLLVFLPCIEMLAIPHHCNVFDVLELTSI